MESIQSFLNTAKLARMKVSAPCTTKISRKKDDRRKKTEVSDKDTKPYDPFY